MNRLLDHIDEWAVENGVEPDIEPVHRFENTVVDPDPTLTLDLQARGIKTVLWATGYRPDYSWLDLPVFDRKGKIRHDGGVGELPGLYVIGHTFLRRRKSSFIHGAEDDARDLCAHIADYLQTPLAV